jgi:hypothetical protein
MLSKLKFREKRKRVKKALVATSRTLSPEEKLRIKLSQTKE